MRIVIYFVIFFCKVIENALATLRLIVVANGKKWLGASLNFVISIIWVLTAGIVIVDLTKDPLKIFFFCLGSFFGSYIGSYIENKIALGNNLLMCIINKDEQNTIDQLRNQGYGVTSIPGYGKDSEKYILIIFTSRKKRHELVQDIKSISTSCMIISEPAVKMNGGYIKE